MTRLATVWKAADEMVLGVVDLRLTEWQVSYVASYNRERSYLQGLGH
jgi:hypothetical protein